MLATSNFVNQMHNGTVNNNPISDSEAATQMTTNKQTNFSPNADSNSKIASENNENSEETNLTIDVNGDSSQAGPEDAQNNEDDSVDITISNVVTNFSVRCHLNLRQIATNGSNVVYRRDQSVCVLCCCFFC